MATRPGSWSSQLAPAPTPARPSSQSRKRQGHIGPLHIWRCPNKVCSGGGSFLLLIWRFRVGAPPPQPSPSLVPNWEPDRARESGTPAWGGRQARRSGRAAAPTAPGCELGWGSPGPARGRGRVRPGFYSRHPGLTRPPRGPWERACGEEEQQGGLGQRPPRRGGALTRASTNNGRVTFQVSRGKIEAKTFGYWFLGHCLASSRVHTRPPVSSLGGVRAWGSQCATQNRKAIPPVLRLRNPPLGTWIAEP